MIEHSGSRADETYNYPCLIAFPQGCNTKREPVARLTFPPAP